MPTRNERRHYAERKKKRVRRYFICDAASSGSQRRPTDDPARIGRIARTPKPCSCYMCGNPRRSALGKDKDRLTIQERRALHDT